MKTKTFQFLLLAALLPAASFAQNYEVITNEHADLQLEYVNGQLAGSIYPNDGKVERNEGLLYDGPQGTTSVTRPAGSQWDFLGVAAGESIYLWPQNQSPGRIDLGFGSDKGTIPSGTFASYFESDPRVNNTARWNKITLSDIRFTPDPLDSATHAAHFSLWQSRSDGSTTVWMASSDGISSSDATWLIEGGHSHFNWGFTRRGYYQIDFLYSGYLNNGQMTYVESAPLTYHFGVEYLPDAIPEPGSIALLAAGLLGLVCMRNRRSPASK
jgi:surface-anchored protein